MHTTATIREKLSNYLQKHRMTINQFARISGINSGTLSSIINGNRPMSMHQLDRITEGMRLEAGYFYDSYIHECIFHAIPDWRRLGPFLQRCAELGKLDCLRKAARMTMENLNYAPLLFETAESFFYNEKNDSALILYKCVAECEKWLQSERLALCQFRIFVLGLGHEQEVNLENSVLFEPYLDRLEENYQFDAYMKLINIYRSLSRWDKVEELAIRMKQKAEIHYQIDRYLFISSKIPKKPIILYVLYANLMLGSVHRERGEYDRALYYVSQYDKPSWVKNSNEEEMVIINQFSEWATANRYLFSIMNGKLSELSNYIDFIDSRTDEIFPALCNIMIVANRHRINIDDILKRYQDYLVLKNHSCSFAKINEQVTMTRYTRLLAELGIYYIYSEEYDSGLSYIVDSLSYSLMIKSDKGVLRCMGIFQQYRHKATPETINRYAELIYQVQKSSIYEWRPLI